MRSASTTACCDVSDEALHGLIEEITQRLQQQERVDIEQVLAAHPEHAARLRQVLPALELVAGLGGSLSELSRERSESQATTTAVEDSLHATLGDFRIIREIGRGGMGIVFEAEQISLGRGVALKVLPFASMLDARCLQRFKNEARAAAGLQHPGIVPVYAVGSDLGVHFYAMQHIAGPTLAQAISGLRGDGECTSRLPGDQGDFLSRLASARARRDPEYYRTIARWGSEIADALEYAHSVGVVHRDIKPANLIVDAHGKVWITDFGLAQLEQDAGLTRTGDVLGTLRYISPEQAQGERGLVDQKTDVYSLGITLYELLTLTPAFPETEHRELLRCLTDDDPVAARSLDSSIPADLETIVHKAIEKDSAQRYATAAEFAADLRRFLAQQPIAARRATPVEQVVKWSRRHRGVVWSALSTLLATTLALAISTFWVIGERNAARRAEIGEREQARLATTHAAQAENRRLEAERERARAEENFKRSREAVDQMLTRVADDKLSRIPGVEAVRKLLLEDALRFYEQFLTQRADDPELQFEAAQAFQRVGFMQHRIAEAEAAVVSLEKAVAIVEGLLREYPDDARYLELLAAGCTKIGALHSALERYRPSEDALNRGLAACRHLQQIFPDDPRHRLAAAEVQRQMCILMARLSRRTEAIRVGREAVGTLRELVANSPQRMHDCVELNHALQALALALSDSIDGHKEADRLLAEAAEVGEVLLSGVPDDRPTGYDDHPELALAGALYHRAEIPSHSKKALTTEHETGLRRAIELLRAFYVVHPDLLGPRRSWARANLVLGASLTAQGRVPEAQSVYREIFSYLMANLAPNRIELLTSAFEGLSTLLRNEGRGDDVEFLQTGRDLIGLIERLLHDTGKPSSALERLELWCSLGKAHGLLNEADQMQAAFGQALETCPADVGKQSLYGVALYYHAANNYREALPFLDRVVALDPRNRYVRQRRAYALFKLGRFPDALGDVAVAGEMHPGETANITWIPPREVAACPDERFRAGMLAQADRAVALAPDSLAAYLARGKLHAALKNFELARQDFASAAAAGGDASELRRLQAELSALLQSSDAP